MPPLCVLFDGLPGSGKTTLSVALADQKFARLCTDEEIFRLHGRYGYDFPRGTFSALERPVLDSIRTRLSALLSAGRDVVFDHGLWTRAERDEWRATAIAAGGLPVLVHLPVPHAELWTRIQVRNRRTDGNAIRFEEHDLHRFAERYERPGPDEDPLIFDGDAAGLRALLQGRDGTP